MQGSGTEQDPFLVETSNDLNDVRNDLSAHYKQISDINLSTWGNWNPITNFSGFYDGQFFEITNLTAIDFYETEEEAGEELPISRGGIFGRITDGEIKRIVAKNFELKYNNNVGCIAGLVDRDAIIKRCFVYDSIVTAVHYEGATGGAGRSCGGIVGSNDGKLFSCMVVNTTLRGRRRIGGVWGSAFITTFAGGSQRELRYCCSVNCNIEKYPSNVSEPEDFGGVIGVAGAVTISDCYAASNVETSGIVNANAFVGRRRANTSMTNNYYLDSKGTDFHATSASINEMTYPIDKDGAFSDFPWWGENEDYPFWSENGKNEGFPYPVAIVGANFDNPEEENIDYRLAFWPSNYEGKNEEFTGDNVNFVNRTGGTFFDFDDEIKIGYNIEYKIFSGKNGYKPYHIETHEFLKLEETRSSLIRLGEPVDLEIDSQEKLFDMRYYSGGNFSLENDIEFFSFSIPAHHVFQADIGESNFFPVNNFWENKNEIRIILDGNNKTISDINLDNTPKDVTLGFFRELGENSSIKNIKFKNYNIEGGDAAAGFISRIINSGSELKNITITNSTLKCNFHFGGLTARSRGDNVFKDIKIESDMPNDDNQWYYCGGLIGYSEDGDIFERCSYKGDISGGYVGGLTGWGANNLYDCFAIADINGINNAAGISGGYWGPEAKNCYFAGSINHDSSETAPMFVDWGYPAGSIENCYYDKDIIEVEEEEFTYKDDEEIPRSTEDMTFPYNEETTYLDWDFDNIWFIAEDVNDGYPTLEEIIEELQILSMTDSIINVPKQVLFTKSIINHIPKQVIAIESEMLQGRQMLEMVTRMSQLPELRIYVKDNEEWKPVINGYVKDNGIWKSITAQFIKKNSEYVR